MATIFVFREIKLYIVGSRFSNMSSCCLCESHMIVSYYKTLEKHQFKATELIN